MNEAFKKHLSMWKTKCNITKEEMYLEGRVELYLCLTEHHVIKTYWGVEV
jgi:hypothetical protein